MKIVQINATCGQGSTGKICVSISRLLVECGVENYVLYSVGNSDYRYGIKYCGDKLRLLQSLFEKVTGSYGFGLSISTKKLIKELDRINPDIVHIHNIHTHDCNIGILCDYLKRKNKRVFWTFHDCWAFTGYCTYFDYPSCNKWKTGCEKCLQYKKYSALTDRSRANYIKKKKAVNGLDLKIITPSRWLLGLCKQAFVSIYPVYVINNGIDLDIFKPSKRYYREIWKSESKTIILGVAMKWSARKGLDVFIKLANDLGFDYQIVLVGTDDKIDEVLPNNIISIHRTKNQEELAAIYSSADLFVNPTMEDNFPTVNIESIACGTPVLTYNSGGAAEMLNPKCGFIVNRGNYSDLLKQIQVFRDNQYNMRTDCQNQAKDFCQSIAYKKYIDLYFMS